MQVKTCVIPCAGMGTRLRPLSLAVPKELLPWGRRPLIEHIWQEMWDAGIRKFVIVLRPGKEIIRQHLEAAGLEAVYVEQTEPLGQADALRSARKAIDGPFVMGLPDQQFATGAAQLVRHYDGQDSLSSMVRVDRPEFFPGASAFLYEGEGPRYRLLGLGKEEGLIRAFGRTIYSREFLDTIPEKTTDGSFGSIFLDWIKNGRHEAVVLEGEPADLGTLEAYVHYQKSPPP